MLRIGHVLFVSSDEQDACVGSNQFTDGKQATFPYSDIVHLRRHFLTGDLLGDSNAPLAIPFFAYSVAVSRPARTSATIVGAAALALSSATFYGPGEPDPLIIVVWFLLFGVGWLVGASIRGNQVRAARLTRTVDDLEAQRDEVAAAAIAEERARLARELHDAVGHAVNVMVLQAGAARMSRQPEKAFEALSEIEALGRDALSDLDHMLGLCCDLNMLVVFKRLCRYYHGIDPVAAAGYVHAYWEMWDMPDEVVLGGRV